jgi:hypothetical protein
MQNLSLPWKRLSKPVPMQEFPLKRLMVLHPLATIAAMLQDLLLRWGLTTCGLPTCNGAVAAVVALVLSVTLLQPLRQVWRNA